MERRADKRLEALNRHKWERKDQRPYQACILMEVTPLNASRVEVLVAVQDKNYVQWPKPLKVDPKRRDLDKYCQFHRTHGHDTNDYYQLMHEIERLIKRGHLQNFVKKGEEQRIHPRGAEKVIRKLVRALVNDGFSGMINMIVGGTDGKMSWKGKKRGRHSVENEMEVMQVLEHTPMTISFFSEDTQGIQMPYEDALVIEVVIHNF